ncbi:hypothetical protein [Streptomyces sp. NPDC059452]|uniref:hypothetical protein n=1 Tax=Streptomyces sp. NPDC059452 TaxID=3346835 RepID=UPI00369BC9D5
MRGPGRRARDRKRARAQEQEQERELEAEVTAFGEMLAGHSFAPGDPATPPEALDDWARALDAYDAASRALHRRGQAEVVPQLLREGLDALVDLEARVAGAPLPQRLPPCFFDPRHGQSATEVRWAPSDGAKRLIAVCAADAIRLREGSPPLLGGRPAPVEEPGELPPGGPDGGLSRPVEPFRSAGLSLPWTIGLLVLVLGYGAALVVAGDLPGAVLAVIIGGNLGAVALLSGILVGDAAVDLWVLVRRGRLTRAAFVRSARGRSGAYEHVYAVTDASGRRREFTRRAGGRASVPVPLRTVWYLPKADGTGKGVSSWSPVWLPLRVLLGLPVVLGSAAVTLYLIPGRLITVLLP